MNLLSLVPSWWRIALAVALLLGAYGWGRMDGAAPVQAKLERERAAWARGQADALAAEIKRGNDTITELRGNHAEAEEVRKMDRKRGDEAIAARDRSDAMARRVRDASATDLLAARAAIQAAGATATCGPALDAADLRQRVLEWCEGATRRLGSELVGVAAYAGALKGDDASCRRDYETVTR